MTLLSTGVVVDVAKVCVFSDPVLCVGEMGDDPNAAWKNKIKWYSETNHFKELNRIDGMQTEFEWNVFPGFTQKIDERYTVRT